MPVGHRSAERLPSLGSGAQRILVEISLAAVLRHREVALKLPGWKGRAGRTSPANLTGSPILEIDSELKQDFMKFGQFEKKVS